MLLGMSIAFAALFEWVRLPGALLLGPMIAAIIMHTCGGRVVLPKVPVLCAQATIGLLLARAITSNVVVEFGRQWLLFGGIVIATICLSVGLGWAATRLKLLRGTTAIWGLMPGAANLMMLMADAFGADARLVAFMQYLRVVVVATTASLVARLFVHAGGAPVPAIVWFPAFNAAVIGTIGLIGAGAFIGVRSRIAGGVIIVPLVLGGLLHATGLVPIELPPWLLAISYAFVGWNVGLRFTREVLGYAVRTLPQVLACIIILVVCCGGLGLVLVKTLGIDVLTAYLATSPGGADSVAIIAASASTKVDVPFVMALQTVRFLSLVLIGPLISRVALKPLAVDAPSRVK
jgi:membrane AbrB-like protein